MLLKKLFGFDAKTMRIKTELVAGLTTFLAMCYILAVNPDILSTTGMSREALFTSTAIAATIGIYGKVAICASSEYGFECLFCLYALPGYGAFVAASTCRDAH